MNNTFINNKIKLEHLEYLYNPRVLEDRAKRIFEIDRENMELMKTLNLIMRSKGKIDCWREEINYDNVSKFRETEQEKIAEENKKLYNRLQTSVGKYSTVHIEQNSSKKNKSKLSSLENSDTNSKTKKSIKSINKHQVAILKDYKLQKYPRCFFELKIIESAEKLGRIIFELYVDVVPKTCENFIALCKGVDGLSYKNTPLHRIISGYLCQGGDITNFNGIGGTSIYGGDFQDENFKLKHSTPGIISMWNCGKNTNNSKFNLIFKKLEVLDGKNVVFGKIIDGLSIIHKVEEFGTKIGRPKKKIIISDCGLY